MGNAFVKFNNGILSINDKEGKPIGTSQPFIINSDKVKEIHIDTPIEPRLMEIHCKNMTRIKGLENVSANNMSTMKNMFKDCTSLKEIDVSEIQRTWRGINGIESTSGMFENCESLEKADIHCKSVSYFYLGSVNDTSNMFKNCKSLKEVNAENIDTKNVKNMQGMFENCKSLQNINLKSMDTYEAYSNNGMKNMFKGCDNLQEIKTSKAISDNLPFFHATTDIGKDINGGNSQKDTEQSGMVWVKPHTRNGKTIKGFYRRKK